MLRTNYTNWLNIDYIEIGIIENIMDIFVIMELWAFEKWRNYKKVHFGWQTHLMVIINNKYLRQGNTYRTSAFVPKSF